VNDEVLDAESLYRLACRAAYRDGLLEEAERLALEALAAALSLDAAACAAVRAVAEAEAEPGDGAGALEPRELFRDACRVALADGVVEPEESRLLNALRRVLGLRSEEVKALFLEAHQAPRAPPPGAPLAPPGPGGRLERLEEVMGGGDEAGARRLLELLLEEALEFDAAGRLRLLELELHLRDRQWFHAPPGPGDAVAPSGTRALRARPDMARVLAITYPGARGYQDQVETQGEILSLAFPRDDLAVGLARAGDDRDRRLELFTWRPDRGLLRHQVRLPDDDRVPALPPPRLAAGGRRITWYAPTRSGIRFRDTYTLPPPEGWGDLVDAESSKETGEDEVTLGDPDPFDREVLGGPSPDGTYRAHFPVVPCLTPEDFPGRIDDLRTGGRVVCPVEGVVRGLRWSPCSRYVATYEEPELYRGHIRVYRAATGEVLGRLDGLVDPDGNSPMADSAYYASAPHDRSDTLRWDDASGALRTLDRSQGGERPVPFERAPSPTRRAPRPRPPGLAFAGPPTRTFEAPPRYRTLTWTCGDVLVWDLEERRVHFEGCLPWAGEAEASPDGARITGPGGFWTLRVPEARVDHR
jgi:hypothetical protein